MAFFACQRAGFAIAVRRLKKQTFLIPQDHDPERA
jgi:hypothetical protein